MANNMKVCPYCKGQVDIDYDQYKRYNRGYYHEECYEKKRQEEKDKFKAKNKKTYNYNSIVAAAKKYLCEYYVDTSVRKQATDLMSRYAAKDICEALKYFYEVKQNDPSKSNGGIIIVDYIINDSQKYYAEKEKILKSTEGLDRSFIDGYEKLKASQPTKAVRQRVTKPKHVKYFILE